jgi:putative transcriptional regulator
MLALRKRRAKSLAAEIGITEANLSLLRSGKVKGVRFETLASICEALDCKPGDILDIEPDEQA